jgi:PAS domain S-box-containing protein
VSALCRPIIEAAELAEMGIAVSTVNGPDVRRLYVSDVAARILGYSVEELVGRSTFMSFAPEEAARMQKLSEDWRSGRAVPHFLESVVVRKDGTHVPVEVAYSGVTIDGKSATVSFLRDITVRKRTEEALRKSEALFRKLVEAAPEAVAVTRDEVLAYTNPRFLAMLGYDNLDEIGRDPWMLIAPDDRAAVAERLKDLAAEPPDGSTAREYRLVGKNGRYVFVEASSMPIDFEGGPALLTFMRDVTKRKEAQTELMQIDRMATVGTLAAAVAHELNNPLAYVLLNLGLFERELDGLVQSAEDRARVRDRLAIVREGATHMASIVNELLAFCRPSSPPETVDPTPVLESAIKMSMNELTGRARLVRDYAVVRPVVADRARLGQVFLNLLLNAAQSFEEGDRERNEIRVVLREEGEGHVAISITDTGQGIAPETLERIFDPFFTTKPAGVGTGLGLSICRSILDTMQGTLSVESRVGAGSTFLVKLPIAADVAPPVTPQRDRSEDVAPRSAVVPADRGAARLLIVDDERSLGLTLVRVLEAEHDVVAVTSASEALELVLGGTEFDVILCDIVMPGLSGIQLHEVLEHVRPHIAKRMIFMTGGDGLPGVSEFLSRIDNACLAKPVDLRRLGVLIRDIMAA